MTTLANANVLNVSYLPANVTSGHASRPGPLSAPALAGRFFGIRPIKIQPFPKSERRHQYTHSMGYGLVVDANIPVVLLEYLRGLWI